MRASALSALLCSVVIVSACGQNEDAAEKANRKEIGTQRDDVTRRLAIASENAGDLASAEHYYMDIAKSSGNSAAGMMELAAFYTRHDQNQRSEALLEKAYAQTPKDVRVLRAYANSLIATGNVVKALSLLDSAIAEHASDAYLYNSKGVALDKQGRYDEAQSCFNKAIALKPEEEMDFKTNLSMSQILQGKYKDAIALLTPLLSRPDVTPAVRQNLALAYGLKGDIGKATLIGSKDLTEKEMNENIRFYQLLSKRNQHVQSSQNSPADIFPVMNPPPVPVKVESNTDLSPTSPAPKPLSAVTLPEKVADDGTTDEEAEPAKPEATVAQSKNPAAQGDDKDEFLDELSPASGSPEKPLFETDKIPLPTLRPDTW